MLLAPSLGAFSALCVTIRHLYVRNVCVCVCVCVCIRHHHAIPQKDVNAVNPHSAQYVRWTRLCKAMWNIAVDVFGVISLVFRRICTSRAPVNVASSVRTHVTIRGKQSGSSWSDWIGFTWMLCRPPETRRQHVHRNVGTKRILYGVRTQRAIVWVEQ
jgi:hypothetical protein